MPATRPDFAAKYLQDGTLAIAEADGRLVFRAPPDFAIVNELTVTGRFAFSLDGTKLAQAAPEDTLIVRALPGGDTLTTLVAPDGPCPFEHVAFSAAGNRVLGYGTGGLCAFDIAGASLLMRIAEPVASAAFDEEGVVAAVGVESTEGPSVVRFDAAGQEVSRISLRTLDPDRALQDPVISPDGGAFAAWRSDISAWVATLWSALDGRPLWSRAMTDNAGMPATFSPRGDYVMMGRVFAVADGALVTEIPWEPEIVDHVPGETLSLAPSGTELAALLRAHFALLHGEGLPRFFGGHTLEPSGSGAHLLRSLAVTPDGTTLMTLGLEGLRLELADRFEDSIVSMVTTGHYLSRVEVSSDGRWASYAGDGRQVVDLTTSERRYFPSFEGGGDEDLCIWLQFRFTPDGRWMIGNSYEHPLELYRMADFVGGKGDAPVPAWASEGVGCPTLAQIPAACPSPIADDASVARGWPLIDLGAMPPSGRRPFDDYVLSPEGRDSILSLGCEQVMDDLGETNACSARLSSVRWGSRELTDLTAPFPSFSPEGHWVVAGPTLVHLPSGQVRIFDAAARVAIFLPNGDLVAGERDGSLARYCRVAQ